VFSYAPLYDRVSFLHSAHSVVRKVSTAGQDNEKSGKPSRKVSRGASKQLTVSGNSPNVSNPNMSSPRDKPDKYVAADSLHFILC
jgi:hypothetical protein